MSKDTTHEFHPFYPWDPLHGAVGNKRQIIEIDLGVEKAWSTQRHLRPDGLHPSGGVAGAGEEATRVWWAGRGFSGTAPSRTRTR